MKLYIKWIPVNAAWRVLGLQVDKMASKYGRQLLVYSVSSHG